MEVNFKLLKQKMIDILDLIGFVFYVFVIDCSLLFMLLVVMIDYSGIHFKCDFTLFVIPVQETVHQGKHKFLHILLFYVSFQTLLHKLVLVPLFEVD